MIFLKELHIESFKNLEKIDLEFDQQYVCFTGNNGVGKTNLLDAIYYLSIGKSFFNSVDQLNILHGKEYFNLRGKFKKKEEEDEIFCALVKGKRKKIKKNKKDYEKVSDHIGAYPVVIITPYDNTLITGGSEERRKFIDLILSQIDHDYLLHLIRYAKTLKQRNAQLKLMHDQDERDRTLLEVYNKLLVDAASYIFEKRKSFLNEFEKAFNFYYSKISDDKEEVSLRYHSQLNTQSLAELFDRNYELDMATQRTNAGIHRDDLDLRIFSFQAKKFASQGQQKSFLLALKLAQFKMMQEEKKFSPILLLDDIFDRLDKDRTTHLMDLITNGGFGQVFITDTNAERIKAVFERIGKDLQHFIVEAGAIVK